MTPADLSTRMDSPPQTGDGHTYTHTHTTKEWLISVHSGVLSGAAIILVCVCVCVCACVCVCVRACVCVSLIPGREEDKWLRELWACPSPSLSLLPVS